jgi:hypothetical protein
MKKLLITGCNDRNMWYSGLVGKQVPFLKEESDAYRSLEPAGFVNFVRKADAQIVEDGLQPVGLMNWAEGQKAIGTKAPRLERSSQVTPLDEGVPPLGPAPTMPCVEWRHNVGNLGKGTKGQ